MVAEEWGRESGLVRAPPAALTARGQGHIAPASGAPSSNGQTAVSDTAYRGSNPRGASSILPPRSYRRSELPITGIAAVPGRSEDRQTLVEGTLVSVRVVLGGRRIIKTKKPTILTTPSLQPPTISH